MKFTIKHFRIMKKELSIVKPSWFRRMIEKFFPVKRIDRWSYDVKFWTTMPLRPGFIVMLESGLRLMVTYSDKRDGETFIMATTMEPVLDDLKSDYTPEYGGVIAVAFKEGQTKN